MRMPILVTSVLALGLAAAAAAPAAQSLARPADGFTLAIPSGWQEDPGAENAISQSGHAGVAAMVFVQREKAPADVTDVLAKVSARMKADAARKVIWSKFDVYLDRPALLAELEDADSRFRITVIPRETGDRSQIFYVITTVAPKAAFTRVAASLDAVRDGFEITAIGKAAAAPAPTSSPGASAARTPPRDEPPAAPAGPAASGPARERFFERILAPPKPGGGG